MDYPGLKLICTYRVPNFTLTMYIFVHNINIVQY